MLRQICEIRQYVDHRRDRDQTLELTHAVEGIDVSSHQGEIDWPAVREALGPYGFVYIKATEGQGFRDKRFEKNVRGATDVGLRVGAYHFARIDTGLHPWKDAALEMNDFVEALRSVGPLLKMAPAVDVELGGIKKRKVSDCMKWMLTALLQLEEETVRMPVLYTGYWTWRYLKRTEEFFDYALWQADYTNGTSLRRPIPGWPARIWQYTGKGEIAGIRGRVDRNRWTGTVSEFEQWLRAA